MNTKGNWTFREISGGPGEYFCAVIDKDGVFFADIYFSGIRDRKEIAAYAQLMAIAPDLLKALQDICDIEQGCAGRGIGCNAEVHRIALKAIKKVEGK